MSGQRILRNTTTTLLSYPRVESGDLVLGVPSTPEVRIGTPASAIPDEDAAWPTGTVDPLSTTVTAAGAVGDTTLTVASAAWVKGRKYLVDDVDGTVLVTAAKTVTGTTLYLTEPLERVISTSATVKGWAITKALTTAQTDLTGNAVAVFRAVVGGVTYSWTEAFRIVRRMVVVPLTGPELTAAYPIVHSLKPATASLEEIIDAAWEYRLLPKLGAKSVIEEDIVDAEVLRPLLALACVVHLAMLSRSADPVWRDALVADFDRLTESTFARVDWHDAPQTADPPRDPNLHARRIGIRVSR